MADIAGEAFRGVDWTALPHVRGWLERIRAEARRVYPSRLMPGHPLPQAG